LHQHRKGGSAACHLLCTPVNLVWGMSCTPVNTRFDRPCHCPIVLSFVIVVFVVCVTRIVMRHDRSVFLFITLLFVIVVVSCASSCVSSGNCIASGQPAMIDRFFVCYHFFVLRCLFGLVHLLLLHWCRSDLGSSLFQCVYTIRMPLRDFLATWGLLIVRPTLSSIDRHLPLRDFFGASRSSLSSFNRFASSVVDRSRDRLHLLVVGVGRCHPTFTFVVSTSALWVALVFTCCHLGLLLCLRSHRTVGTFLAALLGLMPRLG